jgi:glucosyl-3-phosphoglycerate synthase
MPRTRSHLHPAEPVAAEPRHHREFSLADLVARKHATRATVSVCIPARNEVATVAGVVTVVERDLVRTGLVDEIVVMDHASSDATARVAADAGATVVSADEVLADFGPAQGKGDVLWRSLAASRGDLVVWLDADLTSFEAHYVTGLLGPLLEDPSVALVRATYERALGGEVGEGGRVTELLARPLIATLFPDLLHVRQPLGGEYAIRREIAEAVEFEVDYGVEMGLLLDVATGWGVDAIAQVDLGRREHRNRPLAALRDQSRQILRATLARTAASHALHVISPCRPPLSTVGVGRTAASG